MKLKQVANINVGYPFRGKIPEVLDADVLAVQMKDISLGKGIDWSSCLKTNLTGRREPDFLQVGDILFVARGNHNYAVCVNKQPGLSNLKSVAVPHFYVIRCKMKEILPQYLAWFLNQRKCQQYFEQQAVGSLTKSIRRSVLENTSITLIPLAKQQAIVDLENTLQREEEALEKLIQNGRDWLKVIANDLLKTA